MKKQIKRGFSSRVTQKGQVTIPVFIRNTIQLEPYEEVEFLLDEDNIVSLRKKEEDQKNELIAYGSLLSEEWDSEADNLAYNDL
jgi:AbrB family looped-hinge helix DNA binding protein